MGEFDSFEEKPARSSEEPSIRIHRMQTYVPLSIKSGAFWDQCTVSRYRLFGVIECTKGHSLTLKIESDAVDALISAPSISGARHSRQRLTCVCRVLGKASSIFGRSLNPIPSFFWNACQRRHQRRSHSNSEPMHLGDNNSEHNRLLAHVICPTPLYNSANTAHTPQRRRSYKLFWSDTALDPVTSADMEKETWEGGVRRRLPAYDAGVGGASSPAGHMHQPGKPIGFLAARKTPYAKKLLSKRLMLFTVIILPILIIFNLFLICVPILWGVANHTLAVSVMHIYASNLTNIKEDNFRIFHKRANKSFIISKFGYCTANLIKRISDWYI